MVFKVRPVQPLKAELPIYVTELGMVTVVKPLQPSKAEPPISVTELPMLTEVRRMQFSYLQMHLYQSLTC